MITLEQWRALVSVVDSGGYARAAETLNKTQSSVTYAVQKLESLLGVKAFEISGRKARLTPVGELLVRRARALLEEAAAIERSARRLSAGWEPEIGLAAEIVFPRGLLFGSFERFARESAHTRIELFETVLGGTQEALARRQVDLAIAGTVPPGFVGDPLLRLRFLLVARADHALHRLGRCGKRVHRIDANQHAVRGTRTHVTTTGSRLPLAELQLPHKRAGPLQPITWPSVKLNAPISLRYSRDPRQRPDRSWRWHPSRHARRSRQPHRERRYVEATAWRPPRAAVS